MALSIINKIESYKRQKKKFNKKKRKKSKALRLHKYKDKPVLFLQEVLGIELLTEEQQEICLSIRDNQSTNVQAAHGVGKCNYINDKIITSSGAEVTAGSLVGKEFKLLTLDDGKIIEVDGRAELNAIETVYEITTESGRRIIRNGSHPLWTGIKWSKDGAHPIVDSQGWSSILKIKEWMTLPPAYQESKFSCNGWKITDDRKHSIVCAVPDSIPVFGNKPIPEDEIKIMAYLIGDGGMTTQTPIFSQQENKQLREFISCVESMDCRISKRNDLTYGITGKITSGKRNRERGFAENHVTSMLKKHNLMGKGSANKIIPDAIFQLPKKQLSIFLSRLFSTDGWACVSSPQGKRKHGKAEIGFCSVSQEMVEQIQRLLLRFGICSRIYPKQKVNAWVLHIHNSEMLLKFAYEIGIYGKEEAIAEVVDRAIIAQGTKQKTSWRHKQAPKGTIWEKVKSIRKLDRPQQTVAIEVPKYHHYLTHFWEHNSFLMAAIIIWWVFAVGGVAFSTAPTFDQVNDILWKEVRVIYDKNKKKLGGRRTELTLKTININGIEIAAKGFSTKNYDSNSFQGKHDEFLLLIQDEADGITSIIDEAFDSCLSGSKNRGVRVGNPLTPKSAFAKNCESGSIKIPVWNHPNVAWAYEKVIAENGKPIHRLKQEVAQKILKPNLEKEDDPVIPQDEWDESLPRDVIPGAVSIAWIEKIRIKYQELSAYWMSRVEALFPGDTADGIMPLSWLKEARKRYDDNPDYWDAIARQGRWRIGVDVSDGGDMHAISLWRGKVLYSVKYLQPLDDREDTIRLAKEHVAPLAKSLGGMHAIAVDNTGVGAGTLAWLRMNGYFAIGCKYGKSAEKKEQFVNRKTELHWMIRDGLRLGEIAIAPLENEEQVFEELSAVRYNTDTEDKTNCEPKEKTIKRIKRSPDGGDAVVTAWEIPAMQHSNQEKEQKDPVRFDNHEEEVLAKLIEQAQNWQDNITQEEANKYL